MTNTADTTPDGPTIGAFVSALPPNEWVHAYGYLVKRYTDDDTEDER